jgi:2-oxoisovalerate dehydrogenase E1 component
MVTDFDPTNEQQYRCENLADKGKGYGMESYIVDGNNILEVYNLLSDLNNHDSQSTSYFRIKTFRMRGHEEASGTKYVPARINGSMGTEKIQLKTTGNF